MMIVLVGGVLHSGWMFSILKASEKEIICSTDVDQDNYRRRSARAQAASPSSSSSSSDLIKRMAFELTVFCTAIESIDSFEADIPFGIESVRFPSTSVVIRFLLADLFIRCFRLVSDTFCGKQIVGQKQQNLRRI